jgi:hypothetical protein
LLLLFTVDKVAANFVVVAAVVVVATVVSSNFVFATN